jgi:cytochrome c553
LAGNRLGLVVTKLFFFLALSALSAFSGTRDGSGAPLRIYFDFQRTPSPAVELALHEELARLVSPIGLNVEWKSLAEPRAGDASPALVVITFIGRCDAVGLEPRGGTPGALAWTHISDGVIIPFVDVDCERSREFLQSPLLHVEGRLRDPLFGRAIGRLVGHELYHVFAETRHHGKEGVAEPACTASELLADSFRFAEPQFRTLRSSKLKSILSLAKPSLRGSANSAKAAYAANGCGACHGTNGEGSRVAPPLAVKAKFLTPKVLIAHFEKKSEDMYRRALILKLSWYFLTDEEIRDIAAILKSGLEP